MSTQPCTMVIFGGTGDLTHKKLMPALYRLAKNSLLPKVFHVVGVGRRDFTDEEYAAQIYASIKSRNNDAADELTWSKLKPCIHYHRQTFDDERGYSALKSRLTALSIEGNILYYLAVSPEYFETIVQKLGAHGMAQQGERWHRVVIEKPFGRDLPSAQYLNKKICEVFSEKSIYRIDHYLGKSMLQNLLVIRFANIAFEAVWNKESIDHVQISACETVGVGSRGGYYERFGALADMVQNHLVQLLMLTAMEPPASFSEQHIRDKKLEVLKHLTADNKKAIIVRGQYGEGKADGVQMPAYRSEEHVPPDSNTETFAAMKLFINNKRWKGVPFYLRTGKRMPVKSTHVMIEFKKQALVNPSSQLGDCSPNRLIIKIHPDEGVVFEFNAKKPGTDDDIVPVQMDFFQPRHFGFNSPEAYERLLADVMQGDATLFPDWNEIKNSWMFADQASALWQLEEPAFPNYEAGTWGPAAAESLMKDDGRTWWNEQ